jgi:hypothetical protein
VTTAIARFFFILTVALLCALLSANSVPAVLPQAAHNALAAQTEGKIGAASHIQPLRAGFQFPYGQTLRYDGEWHFLTAGVATLRVEQSGTQNHLVGTADATGVVALLYRVQDRFNSYFDAKSLCSNKLMKHTEEGSHSRETTITYDYARGKAVLEERNLKDNQHKRIENDIPGCVTDVVTGILYVASLPLQRTWKARSRSKPRLEHFRRCEWDRRAIPES